MNNTKVSKVLKSCLVKLTFIVLYEQYGGHKQTAKDEAFQLHHPWFIRGYILHIKHKIAQYIYLREGKPLL